MENIPIINIVMQDGTIHNCKSSKIENALLECGLIKEPCTYEEAMIFIWPIESGYYFFSHECMNFYIGGNKTY